MEQTHIQLTENQIEGLSNKKGITLLLGSLALGLLFNLLFYKKPLGLSYPLYITALYTFLFWSIKKKPKLKLDFTSLLGISIIALSFTYFFFSNPFFHVLNFLLIPILAVAHTLLLTSSSRFKWFEASFLLDMLYGIFIRPLENCLKPFSLLFLNTKKENKFREIDGCGKGSDGFNPHDSFVNHHRSSSGIR